MERRQTSLDTGLTEEEVSARRARGEGNLDAAPQTRTVGRIFRDNLVTPFNLLNLALAVLVILVGSWKNVLFMGVILCNIVIGVFQELRAKRAIDSLTLIAAPKARVRRDGQVIELPLEELVLDDIVELAAGDQVGADCVVRQGGCAMNEALLTGESNPIPKKEGDSLLSGSFVSAGHCVAQVVHVGQDNYAAQIAAGAKVWKRPQSEILGCINAIIRGIGFLLLPMGIAMFVKQWFFVRSTPQQAVVSTVAALVGMIPEGLVLLTSVVLAVSVLRLAKRHALAQELTSIEMLARTDVLCLDKTGTLTSGTLAVQGMEVFEAEGAWGEQAVDRGLFSAGALGEETIKAGLAALLDATGDQNATAVALRGFAGTAPGWKVTKAVPFDSARKWSGASFSHGQVWVLGAAEFLFPGDKRVEARVSQGAEQGLRMVVLGVGTGSLSEDSLPQVTPAAIFTLEDGLRPNVEKTISYFYDQDVSIQIISGDDPRTAAATACRAGVRGTEHWVDVSTLKSEEEVRAAAERYTVFGRVTPQQKLWLIQGLKEAGHTVAMTGDGVNDVLALRESDCSIAMAAGSEAARNVSQIVLLDSDFDVMPHIVDEGRRAINNLQRSSALFLTKTCFATLAAFCFLFLWVGYPFQPIQLSLISSLTIGAPSFLLALEPNFAPVRGSFKDQLLRRSLPGGISMVTDVLWCVALLNWFPQTSPEQLSTLCVLAVGCAGLLNLYFVASPLNLRRGAILGLMAVGFFAGAWILRELFSLVVPTGWMWLALGGLVGWSVLIQLLLRRVFAKKSRTKPFDRGK